MGFFSYLRQSLTILCPRPKCDEQKPECHKCITRDTACSYPASTPLVWVSGKAASTDDGIEQKSSREPSPPAYSSGEHVSTTNKPSLNLENIDLIIHWFTKTVYTVVSTSNPAALNICQTVILNRAMEHHFLLHGLLALSALHLAESHPDPQKLTTIATAHHTQGLALYHSILSNINEENYSASIAFSSLTIMFVFALSRPQPTNPTKTELIDHLTQIFLLAKGWHKVVHIADGLECRSGRSIFPTHNPNTIPLSPDIEAAFSRLHALNQGYDTALYALAIQSLKSVFGTLAHEGSENPHVALEWTNTLPEEFVRLIRERENLALVVVGYYCVVLHKVPQVWWLQGWSRGLFDVIWRTVDHIYQDALEFPRVIIEVEG
ncbi:Uncharacterized protein BP5553_02482 [Venustampulla echinocandica]|uniref:Zn(2)-C6 fungal-type domain-containing protein n=1 Tax=Venustampulla echinocandica TaxID=2656787 RepID=A0A370U434_9HELO|nr:Uncharacterized protein BP5553_02482 [Venustampulla echinocandica]RDL42503.1 Uncharacterized protein BP5553_02482 [Venustampulla echinocandica]